jgi:hypothetical protein
MEGSKIRPNRRFIQGTFFHARCKELGSVGFPLNATDDASIWERHTESDVEPPGAGADGQDPRGMKIHITLSSLIF